MIIHVARGRGGSHVRRTTISLPDTLYELVALRLVAQVADLRDLYTPEARAAVGDLCRRYFQAGECSNSSAIQDALMRWLTGPLGQQLTDLRRG